MFITGDFNEPSHRDWTTAAADANQCPLCVEWPSTKAVEDAGFVDAFRAVHPDPIEHPGRTWTPTTKVTDPNDRHDRIDFVFVHGTTAQVKSIKLVGESGEFADIVVEPYPSDHRAVVAEVDLVRTLAASARLSIWNSKSRGQFVAARCVWQLHVNPVNLRIGSAPSSSGDRFIARRHQPYPVAASWI